ncbi:hypothetical protein KQI82_08685 [Oscillibacter sp. MSJ-2]|uniref:Uncharacterized protein n=1 Tax=Dysosmobacter acutus TaxID=2841504 RepID=A0ABS6FC62_9FIRM|nr:hypothetical protein [Dysosmobacter acutus]MBU5626980.1 hypothetical protein [Dysosmobacter acutus]
MGFILPIIGGLVLYGFISFCVKLPGKGLNAQFVELGNLKGKSFKEITDKVGMPSSISSMGDGTTLKQWMATGYHIALEFDENDICLGISSETSV